MDDASLNHFRQIGRKSRFSNVRVLVPILGMVYEEPVKLSKQRVSICSQKRFPT